MAASSSSSSQEKYDVFLSFRGEDTRVGFTGYLYHALREKCVHTYMDEQLESGHEISPTLMKAIQESKIYIIVFSKDFASSRWCLDELVKILECKRNENGKHVIPIFYGIDPSTVRKQEQSYEAAFENHEQRFFDNLDKVQKWRRALKEVADLSGYHSKNFRDDFIYAEEVCKRLRFPSGLESFVSDEIRYFHWDFYPSKYLPYLSTENLVVLTMRNSQLERLWNEDQPLELEKLKKIDLSCSTHLIQIPNLSRAINLQEIYLEGCTSLVHIPPFFQNLNKLLILNMTYCENLEDGTEYLPNSLKDLIMDGTAIKSLPESIWEMKYLELLDLNDCINLRKISEISNEVKWLRQIFLTEAEIEELPEAIGNLTLLKSLNLRGCYMVKFLPKSLCELSVLRQLILEGCSSLEELPPLPRGLEELNITKCERLKSIAELPSSLFLLYANDCRSLETISYWGSPRKPHFSCVSIFGKCLKLDEDTRNNVIVHAAGLLALSGQDAVHARHFCKIMYPGDEIPEWFRYQTDGGNSINIHLPPNWFKLPFRFAFCIVFNMLYNKIDLLDLIIRYEFNFKTNTSNSDDHLHNYYDSTNFCVARIVDLDHAFIVGATLFAHDLSKVFGPNWSSMCSNITEASFRVSLYNWEYDHVGTTKKFGFRFCNAD